jgi:hypothetical protein
MGRNHFILKVYNNWDGETIIELRRDSGCVVAFNRFYYSMLEKLGNHFLRRAHMPKGTLEKLRDVLPPDIRSLLLPEEKDESHSNLLCEEAMCEHLDIQRYAMWSLAMLSQNHSHSLFKSNIETVLKNIMCNVDDEVQEYTCKILMNLCSQEQFPGDIVQLRKYLFMVIDAPDTLETRANKRYARKTLALLK